MASVSQTAGNRAAQTPDFPEEMNTLSTSAEQPQLLIPERMSGTRKEGSSGCPRLPCWGHSDQPGGPVWAPGPCSCPESYRISCLQIPVPSCRRLIVPQLAPVLMAHIPFQKELCFDDELVLQQLRYTGMLETVRIRRSGYSAKYTFQVSHTLVAVVTGQRAGHLPL